MLCGEQRIEIQTEFSKHPQPRVATTITISGRVLHKIQKNWDKTIDSIEEMHEAEELINSQHDEVAGLVKEHGEIIIEQSQQQTAGVTQQSVIERAENIPAIKRAFLLSREGEIEAQGRISQETKILAGAITNIADLLFGINSVSNLGEWEDCVLDLGCEHLLLVPCGEGYLAALVSQEVKKKEILTEMHRMVEEL